MSHWWRNRKGETGPRICEHSRKIGIIIQNAMLFWLVEKLSPTFYMHVKKYFQSQYQRYFIMRKMTKTLIFFSVSIFSCYNILIAEVYRFWDFNLYEKFDRKFEISHIEILFCDHFSFSNEIARKHFNFHSLQIDIVAKMFEIEFFFAKKYSVLNEGNCFGNWIRLTVCTLTSNSVVH